MGRRTGSPDQAATSSPASSHDRILQAAKALFATKGYESTSTVAIARRAGTSESQLIKHFGSKEGLLEAIFDDAWERLNAAVRQQIHALPSPAAKLNTLSELMINALEKDPDLKLLMLLEGRRIRKEGHLVVLTKGFRDFVGLLDAVLEEMRDAGTLRPDLHPQGVRSALIGAVEGLLRDQLLGQRVGFPASYGTKEMRRIFAALVSSFSPAGAITRT